MISAQAHSAIMRNLGRIEGIALCEEEDIQASLIMNADRICEILEAEMRGETPVDDRRYGEQTPVRCRADLIRTLPMRALAEYLKREIGDSVPVDWLGWLTEPIGRKGEHHEKEPRTP